MADELKAGTTTISDSKVRAFPVKPHNLHVAFQTAKSVSIDGREDMSNPQEKYPSDFANNVVIGVSGGFIRVNGGNAVVKLEATETAAPSESTTPSAPAATTAKATETKTKT